MTTILLNHKYLTTSIAGFAITLLLGIAILVAIGGGSLFSLTATQPVEASQSQSQIDRAKGLEKLIGPATDPAAYTAAISNARKPSQAGSAYSLDEIVIASKASAELARVSTGLAK